MSRKKLSKARAGKLLVADKYGKIAQSTEVFRIDSGKSLGTQLIFYVLSQATRFLEKEEIVLRAQKSRFSEVVWERYKLTKHYRGVDTREEKDEYIARRVRALLPYTLNPKDTTEKQAIKQGKGYRLKSLYDIAISQL